MVAEAALNVDPSAAASELYRSQQREKQARSQGEPTLPLRRRRLRTTRPRRPVRRSRLFRPTPAPSFRSGSALDVTQDNLSLPDPSTVPPSPAAEQLTQFFDQVQAEERRAEEQAFIQEQNRRRIEAAQTTALPVDILSAARETPRNRETDTSRILQAFDDQARSLYRELGDSPSFRTQFQGAKKQAISELKELASKQVGKMSEYFYRFYGDASPADAAALGGDGFFWLITGAMVNAYRLTLTFFNVKRQGIKGSIKKYATELGGDIAGLESPEEKKKGIIAEILPSEINPLDPSAWGLDIPSALLGFLILSMIILMALQLAAWIGMGLAYGVMALDLFSQFVPSDLSNLPL